MGLGALGNRATLAELACLAGAWKEWVKENNGRARGRHARGVSFSRARFFFNLAPRAFPLKNGWGHFLREKPWGRGWFFLVPTTSKRLLRGLAEPTLLNELIGLHDGQTKTSRLPIYLPGAPLFSRRTRFLP